MTESASVGKGSRVQEIWVFTLILVCRLAASHWPPADSGVAGL